MNLNECLKRVQSYLENTPLIVLGSGASAAYGLPTMTELRDEIALHADKFDQSNEAVKELFYNIDTGLDLETAVGLARNLSFCDKSLIREIVWQKVNEMDRAFFEKGLQNNFANFSLVSLIKKVLEPTPNKVDIITTNYDRLAEYAADLAGASIVTGFEGQNYKKLYVPTHTIISKRIKARERVVSIWKVHGSLDWFLSSSGVQCALTSRDNIPKEYSPNIVPPGNEKYQTTHFEPYRTIMTQSDNAIANAQSFLVVGYGFNDDHIQPKIIEEIKKGKAIVVITQKASVACKKVLTQSGAEKYLIIEKDKNKTHVISNGWEEWYDEDLWSLSGFMGKW